ncbi:MAG: GHKL domain-containing protein [Lachnospiraceae bacterium]|nr:GHKL domain-containing protein [Lachnospiraceae bacterium]
MKIKMKTGAALLISLVLCIGFGTLLSVYTRPMEDLSLNLSLLGQMEGEISTSVEYDDKGWTVFTQDEDNKTFLEPDGFGGYTGLELGQTFYFSRVLAEELDTPTLQLGAADRRFSVFLDDALIYTDCPELDNRIGYLDLPMNEWDRTEPIIISLPLNYQGKTLTIAQSSPEFSEFSSFKAFPCDVYLYCGYAYESGLIAESFGTAIAAAAAFVVGVFLLIAFVRNQDVGMLFAALVAFLWMAFRLVDASFFYSYFSNTLGTYTVMIRLFAAGALLIFLGIRAGKYRKLLLGVTGLYGLSLIAHIAIVSKSPLTIDPALHFLCYSLPEWIAFAGLLTLLILGSLFWRKENYFYRLFIPLALVSTAVYWIYLFIRDDQVFYQLSISLQNRQIGYVYYRLLPTVMGSALLAALVEIVKGELDRHMEKRLLKEQQELALASYENLRRQHEEVMMLRHDMNKHFQILRDMSADEKTVKYLDGLIGQNENIRPVVQSGNEMLDIILNSKLALAADSGIGVEIIKSDAPETLPLPDAELCSLVMNIMDNALKAAGTDGIASPYIRLDIHVKNDFFVFCCENSAIISPAAPETKKETVPMHGLGLKIIRQIAERHDGVVDIAQEADRYTVTVALPLL